MTPHARPDRTGSGCFQHRCVLFGSPGELRDAVAPVIADAAAAGERVVAAVSPGVEGAMRSWRLAGQPATDTVEFTEHAALYDAPGRTLAALYRMAPGHRQRRLTVVGEPVLPVGDAVELREWHRLDSALELALSGTAMRLVCLLDTRAIPAAVRKTALRTHPVLVTGSGERPNPHYRGEAAFNRPDVGRHLSSPSGHVRTLDIGTDLSGLRAEIGPAAESAGLPPDRAGDLVVAVNELAANVLEHGAGKGRVSLWRRPARLVCDVFDERGGLTDPLSGYRPAGTRTPRGHGLWITRQVCDFMEVSGGAGGSLVRLHFRV